MVVGENHWEDVFYKMYALSNVLHGGIRGTVVAHWTAGQQVERLILRQGHDS